MLKILVVENRIVSYETFMDSLQDYEVQILLEYVPWAQKQSYEQTRLLLWGVLSPYMKQKKTPEKLLPLATDKNILEHEKALPEEQVNTIRKNIMKQYNIPDNTTKLKKNTK